MVQVRRSKVASKEKIDDSARKSNIQQAGRSNGGLDACVASAICKLSVEIVTLSKVKIGGEFYTLDRPIELTNIKASSPPKETATKQAAAKTHITRSGGRKKNPGKEAPVFGPAELSSIGQTHKAVICYEVNILTDVDVLSAGLAYAGFDAKRQQKVNLERNLTRFKAFFGVPPTTVVPLLSDLRCDNSQIIYKECLMTMNWLFCYETLPVLVGRWGYSENAIGTKVIRHARLMQTLKKKKIRFEFNMDDGGIPASLDTVNFLVQEFRLDPSAKWFDPKSHSSGLKYEFCLAVEEPRVVWVNGPFVPSTADITAFRGGKADENKNKWDKSSLYFQVQNGNKLVADGGYVGEPTKIITTKSREHPKEMRKWIGEALAREETLHGRLKSFNILGTRFRHGVGTKNKMGLHKTAVEAVTVIIQYDYENGHPPFDVTL